MPHRHGFIAFIDESGQEGGLAPGRSSEFFVISAVISRTRKGRTPISAAFSAAAKRAGKGPGYRFKKFCEEKNRNHRFLCVDELAKVPITHVTVIAHKPSFQKTDMLEVHGKLYFFVSQLLLERISWACRDGHGRWAEKNPRAMIVFSQRTSLNYEAFRGYAERIRAGDSKYESKAEWDYIDLDAIVARPHAVRCDGLLAADYVASAFGNAIEPNLYGLCDDRFVRPLARNVYRYKGKAIANGLKLFPPQAETQLQTDPRFWWIPRHYAKT